MLSSRKEKNSNPARKRNRVIKILAITVMWIVTKIAVIKVLVKSSPVITDARRGVRKKREM